MNAPRWVFAISSRLHTSGFRLACCRPLDSIRFYLCISLLTIFYTQHSHQYPVPSMVASRTDMLIVLPQMIDFNIN
jgi:hypothetical protein